MAWFARPWTGWLVCFGPEAFQLGDPYEHCFPLSIMGMYEGVSTRLTKPITTALVAEATDAGVEILGYEPDWKNWRQAPAPLRKLGNPKEKLMDQVANTGGTAGVTEMKDKSFKIKTTIAFIGEQTGTLYDSMGAENCNNTPDEVVKFAEGPGLGIMAQLAKYGIEAMRAGVAAGDIAS